MSMRLRRKLGSLLIVSALVALVAGCGGSSDAGESDGPTITFQVIPDYVGDAYENPELGVELRPPFGWEPLSPEQRDEVAEALVDREELERYSLSLVDVFLQASTLSFAALSRVTLSGEPVTTTAEYVESFAEGIVQDDLTSRAEFSVGGLDVTQFRHRLNERVTFTLIFEDADGETLQLDYSIPIAAYEDEGIKLESSIGTLQRITTGQEGPS